MSFETIPDLLAEILDQQRKTTEAVVCLAEALAGIRAKAKADPKPAAAAPTAPVPTQSAPAATTVESPSETTAPAVAVGDVNTAIIGLAKAKGRDAAVAVLQQFGVTKVPELKPAQYADVIAAAQKALG